MLRTTDSDLQFDAFMNILYKRFMSPRKLRLIPVLYLFMVGLTRKYTQISKWELFTSAPLFVRVKLRDNFTRISFKQRATS